MHYTLFTKSNCTQCVIAKNWLKADKTIKFSEISLDDPTTLAAFKEAFPNQRSVPVVTDEDGNVIVNWKNCTNV